MTRNELSAKLNAMTLVQIHVWKKSNGLKASAPRKAGLIAKLVERFFASPLSVGDVPVQPDAFDRLGIARKKSMTTNLPQVAAFEQRTGKSWLEILIAAIRNRHHAAKGLSVVETWNLLRDGKLYGETLSTILEDENFGHDYGTMTQVQLRRVVKKASRSIGNILPLTQAA